MRYWLSNNDGKTVGPHTLDEIRALAASHALSPEAQVCPENSTDWIPAAVALGTTPPTAPVPGLVPTGCCCLCGDTSNRKAEKSLYGNPVCKKCHWAFANRRQGSFVIDFVLWYILTLIVALIVGAVLGPLMAAARAPGWSLEIAGYWTGLLMWLGFFTKDAFRSGTPGRALCGVAVIDRFTGKPITLTASFKRNLPLLIPFMPLVVALQLNGGHRIGDGWSQSKVIWRKHAGKPIFAPETRSP